MCGIAGSYCVDKRPDPRVSVMVESLRHRGPDGCGVEYNNGMTLGHARLAVIDLAETGKQPMWSHDGRYICVLNGEIYNYNELRREIESHGCRLNGTSDTEVLLEAFAMYGDTLIPRLRGMFAIAIWDCKQRRLLFARDHFGKKPLYIFLPAIGKIAFASELRSLKRVCDLEMRNDVLGLYFRFGYIPEPLTIYRSVTILPPGTSAWWSPKMGLQPVSYWQPHLALDREPAQPDLHELDELLAQAVRRRMAADVPLGAFLSGGIDSALIASYVAADRPGVPTITVGFDQHDLDESQAASVTAEQLGMEHIIERIATPDAESIFDRYIDCFDQPFADSSGVPTLVLAEATRRHVTVALGGDGGDEVFGGYDRYRWLKIALAGRRIPRIFRPVLGALLARVPRRGRRMVDMLTAADPAGVYECLCWIWHHGSVEELLVEPCRSPSAWFAECFERVDAPPLMQAQFYDLTTELPCDILVKIDRASMWHSLEVRSPFLDVDVVEWSLRNGIFGCRSQLGKRVLRDLLSRRIPGFDLSRPKRGFALPTEAWLAGPLAGRLDRVSDPAFCANQGLFQPDVVTRTVKRFKAGARELYAPLWAYLVFQEWYERHFKGDVCG